MDEIVNSHDLLLENERLRKELQNLTQSKDELQKINLLFNHSEQILNVGYWEWDEIADRYISCSEQFAKLHDMTVAQLMGELKSNEKDREFIFEGDRERYIQVVDSAVERKQGWDIKYSSYTKAGRRIYLHEIGKSVLDDHGVLVKTIGTIQDITEIRRLEEELKQSQALFQQAEAMGNMGYWCWDIKEDKLLSCSDHFALIYDMTVPEALDYFVSTEAELGLIHPDDKEFYKQADIDANGQFQELDIEYRVITLSGNTRYILDRSEFVYDNDGSPTWLFGITQDITAEKKKEFALTQATKAALEVNRELTFQKHALDEHAIVSIADAAGDITYVNDKFCAISGYDREELLGNNHKIVKSDEHSDEFFVDMWKTISSGHTWHGEIKNTNKTGNVYWVKTTIVPTLDDKGKPFQYVGILTEITTDKNNEEKLKRIAHYDVLTNLPNRVLLADRLNHAMVQCQRRNQSLAVAYMDLDGFKIVNDTYGHNLGDKLLVELSRRMKEALREGDTLARIGGDEFIVVMVDLVKIEDSVSVLERLLKATAEPVIVGETVMQVSVSIGVTLYPQDGADADQLIRHADEAMYVAKHSGKNCYHLFDTAQDSAIKILQQSIGDVRSALGRREFVLHYQLKVNMHTSEVIGVEALIRWQHPDRGLVPPSEFLPVIEGQTISLELGEWVIDTALIQISQWRSMGLHLPISVNISAYQLQQGNFTTRLTALLAAHPEIDPHYLELEILESSVLSDIGQVLDTMNACHELGVRFALDDFGTGYSSLVHLRRLPAYLIKIDQSFVRDMLEDADDFAIVKGVVGLAKAFHREVIAEGVETIAHGAALLHLGCELAQGYGIARPMPAGDIPEWISNWKADDSWQAKSPIE
jgi:diguanylate cyclase (GGDEF)-like protein/PAS domain S-box-containing protein